MDDLEKVVREVAKKMKRDANLEIHFKEKKDAALYDAIGRAEQQGYFVSGFTMSTATDSEVKLELVKFPPLRAIQTLFIAPLSGVMGQLKIKSKWLNEWLDKTAGILLSGYYVGNFLINNSEIFSNIYGRENTAKLTQFTNNLAKDYGLKVGQISLQSEKQLSHLEYLRMENKRLDEEKKDPP